LSRADLCSWNLLRAEFLFVKLATCWFFLSVKLVHWFSPPETDSDQETCSVLVFDRGNFRMLIFVRKTCFILFFLFAKLVLWFFSSWNWFCSWNLLHAYFCSWSLLHLNFYLHENFTQIFYPCETDLVQGTCFTWIFVRGSGCVPILFKKLLSYWFSFVELAACWFLFLKLVLTFFSSWKIFYSWNLFSADFLLVDLVACWFFSL